MDRDDADDWTLIGRVVGAFGVRGEMKVQSFSAFPDRFKNLKEVYVGDQYRRHEVIGSRFHKYELLRLSGIDTPEQVNALRGSDLWIPRSEAMALPEGEYYADDIIGLTVETTQGQVIGQVTDLLETPANDVYVVRGQHGEVLVPAIRDVVRELDVVGGRIIVDPIEGLLDA